MYQEKRLAFFYAVSPVHMGSGTSLGLIDNPVQRERHTNHPLFAGSGMKGAAREAASHVWGEDGRDDLRRIFGPETDASDHAGAVSFSDAVLVAFPVRSLREGFVYATSPFALARLARMARAAGAKFPELDRLDMADSEAVVLDDGLLSEGKLVLESYEFQNRDGGAEALRQVADWLSSHALPPAKEFGYFKEKLARHLVLLSETQFTYFVTNSTVVEPHVRIDDVTGTAAEGGLFFTENVPPESIFCSLIMASRERRKSGAAGAGMGAGEVMEKVVSALDKGLLQVGGDATIGRGQVVVSVVDGRCEG